MDPESLGALLDSLIPITLQEITTAHANSIVRTEADIKRGYKLFRRAQPGILRYIPYDASIPEPDASHNSLLCACVLRVCLALEGRFSWVPVPKTKDLLATEVQVDALLAQPSLRSRVDTLPVIMLMNDLLSITFQEESMHAGCRERVMRKMLSIYICFSRAYAAHPDRGTINRPLKHSQYAMGILTPAQFTQELAGLLQRARPNLKIEVIEDLDLTLKVPDGPEKTAYLDNAYREYLLDLKRRREIMSRHVSAFLDTLNMTVDWARDRSQIVPVLKYESSSQSEAQAGKSGGPSERDCAKRLFSEDLVVNYVVDTPLYMVFVRNQDVVELNLSVEELHQVALRNLARILPAHEIKQLQGVYQVKCGGYYEGSLLLLDEFWNRATFQVRGDIVVALPARGWLLLAGSEDAGGLRMLSQIAEEVHDNWPYSLSLKLLIRRQGKFVPYSGTPTST